MPSLKEERKEDILKVLDRFICMQSEHLHGFATGDMAQILGRCSERENMFRSLKHNFGIFAETLFEGGTEFHILVKRKMKKIQHGERLLMGEVAKQRDIIHQKLGKIRKGRKVLSCYSLKREISSPRFVSNRS